MCVIEIDNLTKRYGRSVGVESLSISVPRASICGFLGPNGAGKTTTIRILMGLLKPTAGTAAILDRDCWAASPEIRKNVGYLPGDLRLYPYLHARSALRLSGAVRARDLQSSGEKLLDRFELDPLVRVRDMSRGMRQKLGLILALAHQPKILILDEPTNSLDPIIQERLYEYLRERARAGTTVFLSSHALDEVEQLCERVAILRRGRLVANESIDTLRDRAKRVVTIKWPAGVTLPDPPPCLSLQHRDSESWSGTLVGAVDELIRWCADQPLADLELNKPDLASVFQAFYKQEGSKCSP